jgi:AAA+ ATPase superfamily predicted ATPase
MVKLLDNPFVVAGYESPDYFCDRETETETLISALKNARNVALISPRRIGKTGLIHNVFYHLRENDKNIRCFYIDIFSTQNLSDFVVLFGQSTLGQLDRFSGRIAKNITAFFKSIRPTFSFDELTGNPTVSFDIQPQKAQDTLREIFLYLKESGKEIYIAFDEFQQITEYPEKGTEALLRSYIQFLPNVKFIFSGSKKHIMDAMFSSVARPFYRSTQIMGLREIPIETYRAFAINLFAKYDRNFDARVFNYIYNKMLGHTWYIQVILNQLFVIKKERYSTNDADILLQKIFKEENAIYKTYCELITKGQLRLLKAIAAEGKVTEPYGSRFIQRYGLTAPSSVKLAIKSLINKSLLLKDEEGKYFVYDRFFSLWLEKFHN